MSRKKLVSYIRPEEPKFLRELKEQIQYKEKPTINTKKEVLPRVSDDEAEDIDGEKPLVVVLNSGDLTAEEAEAFEKQKQKEEAAAPADLSKRIIFSKDKLKKRTLDLVEGPDNKKIKKNKHKKAILSFNDEEEENLG
ncbi:hypothetical protein HZH68_017063 [Vespula germanica]|uniref:DUF4604 domain-containing protein n=2 Tax=Vespula TaxID=7451 RepID=A0A834MQI7_VESGE|nr:uncharacterized protein KIAA1143 homolog [Vespula pensylvanica]KAF7379218.1 hypothetical protein HZH68_017063 [Vespula germanica]KAF7387675.1 hypothetical protein H0235_018397 [Vespula pensylvanica]